MIQAKYHGLRVFGLKGHKEEAFVFIRATIKIMLFIQS